MQAGSNPIPALAATLSFAFLLVVAPLWIRFRTRPFALALAYWGAVVGSLVIYAVLGETSLGRMATGLYGVVPGVLMGRLFAELGGYRHRVAPDLWVAAGAIVATGVLAATHAPPLWIEFPLATLQGASGLRGAGLGLLYGRSLGFLGRCAALVSLAFSVHGMTRTTVLLLAWDLEIGWMIATVLAFAHLPLLLGALVEHEARRATELEYDLRTQRALASTGRLATIGELAASIVHELGTPLATLQIQLELLRRQTADGTYRPEQLPATLDDLGGSVDQLRTILRSVGRSVREGDGDPFEVVAGARVVDDALQMVEGRLRTASVRLTHEPGTEDALLRCRRVEVAQVVANLLLNACDAVEPGDDAQRWVKLAATVDEDAFVLRVSDGGSGVPDELRTEIFRALVTTKPAGRGMGLGLSFARRVAAEHGGTLELESLRGPTTFVLRLPLARSAADGAGPGYTRAS